MLARTLHTDGGNNNNETKFSSYSFAGFGQERFIKDTSDSFFSDAVIFLCKQKLQGLVIYN